MTKPIVLIVDDEPDILELLEITIERMDLICDCASDLNSALMLLKQKDYQLCLTDMRLPDGDGLDLVDTVQQLYPKMPIAVISAHGNMDTAIKALKSGAFDFLTKPIDLDILRKLVSSALRLDDPTTTSHIEMIGHSKHIENLKQKITKLARSQAPVYISGESGTGKELVARLIHSHSNRSDHPFVPVNCSAIPSELMESELFGHKKGSFTGAVNDKKGLFQTATGGTLFLDEIADLPLSMQVKLLRAIQEKKIRPVGAEQEIQTDTRILSATHKNLSEMVNQGEFRQDLYYRINVIELDIPPLRERTEDIPDLIDHILNKIVEYPAEKPSITKQAAASLQQYHYPGNIRELENILERALTLSDNNIIDVDDLQLPEDTQLTDSVANLDGLKDELEKQAIIDALEQTKWNKTAAAKKLGITFRALRYRLEKLNIK